jgi:hypothetical protein
MLLNGRLGLAAAQPGCISLGPDLAEAA